MIGRRPPRPATRRLPALALAAALLPALALALAAALLAGAACAPLPLLQGATVVPRGQTWGGVAGTVFVPTSSPTTLDADGVGSDDTDLAWRPLPAVVGYVRRGVGPAELQATFHLPAFAFGAGVKLGLVGRSAGSPFSLAVAADLSGSPVLGDAGLGGALLASLQPSPRWTLDLGGRAGLASGLWRAPAVTATAGVTLHRERDWHVLAGVTFAPFGELASHTAAPGLLLAVGSSWKLRRDDRQLPDW